MASVSGIVTPLVVKIKDRSLPVFKKHPFKLFEDDLAGVFSSTPYNVLHNEDIRAYIHCDLEELRNADMLDLYNKHLVNGLGNLEPEYKELHDKGLSQFVHLPLFDEVEWIHYIPSHVHDEFIWLDRPHKLPRNQSMLQLV